MSARTTTYDTWKILETIEQDTANTADALARLDEKIAEIDAVIADLNSDDGEAASDMGFVIQVNLLKVVRLLLLRQG